MEKVILDSFIQELKNEMDKIIIENVPFLQLENKRNILILRSAKIIWLEKFLKNLSVINQTANLYVIGKETDKEVLEKSYANQYELAHCEGGYNIESLVEIVKSIEKDKFDAIVFLNHTKHDFDYLNIEEVVAAIAERQNCAIFSYSVAEELDEYTNIQAHIRGQKLYYELIEWFWEAR